MPTSMLRAVSCGVWGKLLPLVMHSVDGCGGRGSLLPINMPLELQQQLLLMFVAASCSASVPTVVEPTVMGKSGYISSNCPEC